MANVQLFDVHKADVVSNNIDINAALAASLASDYKYYVRVTDPVAEDAEVFKAAKLFKHRPDEVKIGKIKMSWGYGWLYDIVRNGRPIHSGSWYPEILEELGEEDVLYISPVPVH